VQEYADGLLMHLHAKFFDINVIDSDVWRNNTKEKAVLCCHANAFNIFDVDSDIYCTTVLILSTT